MQENAPWHGNKMRLFSETGFNLTIKSDGTVLGINKDDRDSVLELSSAGEKSLVRIRGVESQLYLCFDDSGKLYGEQESSQKGTVFKEKLQASYNTYKSEMNSEWYVGINKNGRVKKVNETHGKVQKAVKFLPRKLHS